MTKTRTANIMVSGSGLLAARQRKGLTQTALATDARVARQTIVRVEGCDVAHVLPDTYKRIIDALDVAYEDLIAEPKAAA